MSLIRIVWNLGKEFFINKDQRVKACFLLVMSILLQIGMVYSSVLMNKWSNDFYNALQNLDKDAVYKSVRIFCVLVGFTILVFVGKYVCQARLALNWRKFMTEKYYAKWLNNSAYFGSNLLTHKNDNPDQRISEDLNSFVSMTIELSFEILSSVLTLASFLTILWSLSGTVKLSVFGMNFSIYGYMVWAALIYSALGTIITYKIGKKLAGVNYLQEKKEANFRFSLMRLRENSADISLYKGENFEKNIFKNALEEIIKNSLTIISINKNLGIWTNFYNNFANIFPILLASPRFFSKEIQLGGLMQIAGAFGKVQESLSFLIKSFKSIASYKAVVDRLNEFNNNIDYWNEALRESKIKITKENSSSLVIKDLNLTTPNNKMLFNKLNLSFLPAKSYLIMGKNGAGKSTLIQAIAGIWPFGEGEISLPENKKVFFIPQHSYMNIGTLGQVIAYPSCEELDENYIIELLNRVNLSYLVDRLKMLENWSISLSLGEQQKIAILRAIINNPDILVLDESSSSLTIEDESIIYKFLREKLANTTIISVGHRDSLRKYHDQEVTI